MYPCKKCGNCCRRVGDTEIGFLLANENGICRYFDESSNLCRIYNNRPIYCNIDEYYYKYLSKIMSIEEFYELNNQKCISFAKQKLNGEDS